MVASSATTMPVVNTATAVGSAGPCTVAHGTATSISATVSDHHRDDGATFTLRRRRARQRVRIPALRSQTGLPPSAAPAKPALAPAQPLARLCQETLQRPGRQDGTRRGRVKAVSRDDRDRRLHGCRPSSIRVLPIRSGRLFLVAPHIDLALASSSADRRLSRQRPAGWASPAAAAA